MYLYFIFTIKNEWWAECNNAWKQALNNLYWSLMIRLASGQTLSMFKSVWSRMLIWIDDMNSHVTLDNALLRNTTILDNATWSHPTFSTVTQLEPNKTSVWNVKRIAFCICRRKQINAMNSILSRTTHFKNFIHTDDSEIKHNHNLYTAVACTYKQLFAPNIHFSRSVFNVDDINDWASF